MRSSRKAMLVAAALASGGLFGMGTYTALAQGFGDMPGSPPMPSGNPYSVNMTRPSTTYAAGAAPRTAAANPTAGGASSSPYNNYTTVSPGAASARPGPEAVRTSYTGPAAATPAPSSPYSPGFAPPNAATAAAAPTNPQVKPYLARIPSQADAPKPKGLRRFFSMLWHGGSSAEDETKHAQYDYSTGRTDLPNARPWMGQPNSK